MNLFDRLRERWYRRRPWYDIPTLFSVRRLIEVRNQLRRENLHDTEEPPWERKDIPANLDPKLRNQRSIDGTYNDLHYPRMGSAGARLGRNVPLQYTIPDRVNLLIPSPRTVSLELMTRDQFQPATIVNLLAAAWIQFMVHDWFVHKKAPGDPILIPIGADDPWPEKPMRVPRTLASPAPPGSSRPPAYENENSHWWDGSQIYGCDPATVAKLRTGVNGKLKVQADGKLLLDPESGVDLTGFIDNWWIGLSLFHALFTVEHNAICDQLKSRQPSWTDDQLYAKARLINAALMAKIHTVEWTLAILPHPTIQLGLRTNWYGIAGEKLQDAFKFLDDSEILGGIVGSEADHHAAPYSLTEEFVSVYRMHPLIPDELTIRSVGNGRPLETVSFPDLAGRKNRAVLERHSMTDLFYSFGVTHPGAIRLHNYPRHLQFLTRDDGTIFDLAAVDILRDRERGVPRYNQFRRLIHKEPVKSFEELTDNPQWASEIRRVYNGDLESVDLMVGLFAEPLPKGFGFSETAFRVFILMASHRLKSDRFFTDDYGPELYTEWGIRYIRDNGLASILQRHFPGVGAAVAGLENPFAPWKAVAGSPP